MREMRTEAGLINKESNYIVDCTGRKIKVISTPEDAHKSYENRVHVSSGVWSDMDDPWDV